MYQVIETTALFFMFYTRYYPRALFSNEKKNKDSPKEPEVFLNTAN